MLAFTLADFYTALDRGTRVLVTNGVYTYTYIYLCVARSKIIPGRGGVMQPLVHTEKCLALLCVRSICGTSGLKKERSWHGAAPPAIETCPITYISYYTC